MTHGRTIVVSETKDTQWTGCLKAFLTLISSSTNPTKTMTFERNTTDEEREEDNKKVHLWDILQIIFIILNANLSRIKKSTGWSARK